MTIWINTPFDSLPGEEGRPLRYRLLAEALVRRGHAVVIWSSDWHHVKKASRGLTLAYQQDGIEVRLVPTLPYRTNIGWSRWKSHASYAKAWGRLAAEAVEHSALQKPDCVLLALPPLGLFQVAESLAKSWGSHLIVDIQDLWPETFHRLLPRGLRFLGKFIFYMAHKSAREAYRKADAVSAVSESYRQVANREDLRVFSLGMQIPVAETRVVRKGEALRLLYIGNLGTLYAIEVLLEGVAKLVEKGAPVTLDVAGDGPFRSHVEAYAKRIPAIVFHGYLSEVELDGLFRSCDVGVVPMRQNSGVAVPNKVIDYAMNNLCILNGLKGKTEDLLAAYDAGVSYQVDDCTSLVCAIRELIADREVVRQKGLNARRMAESCFDGEQIYQEMACWIEEITLKGLK